MVLSYRHGFHAGNVADVMKHLTLTMLTRATFARSIPYHDALPKKLPKRSKGPHANDRKASSGSRLAQPASSPSSSSSSGMSRPMFYIDTHAGAARFDLHGTFAQKNREYNDGIAVAWRHRHTIIDQSPSVAAYFDCVKALNSTDLPLAARLSLTSNPSPLPLPLPLPLSSATTSSSSSSGVDRKDEFPFRFYPGDYPFIIFVTVSRC
jgi:hypothetical protein